MKHQITYIATHHPRWVYAATLLLVVALGSQIPRIHIDTDPENMLPEAQPSRVFHNLVKARFDLHDAMVVGAVNETDPDGIYNPRSLAALHALSERIMAIDGVIDRDLMSLANADNITQAGPGTIRFEWMMRTPPADAEAAAAIRDAVARLPLLLNTLVSGDGRAAAVYVPIESKDLSYQVSRQIQAVTAELDSDDDYHITGLPVAEDTFGHQMFVQMGISAPLAGLMIFLLMWYFFKSPVLVVAPMIVAMATVIVIMGALIGLGFTVHIMSSMIPIFLMPIAVVDSVHIMSEFADSYSEERGADEVIRGVIDHLYAPMLYTSVTSAIGFASLLLTPIPPVQVFGAFVAAGILLAFLLTIVFVPAYVVRMRPAQLAKLHAIAQATEGSSMVARGLRGAGRFAFSRPGLIIGVAAVILALSVAGIARIQINDNPVRWFKQSHPVRVADRVLNEHFAGTYDAFLVLTRPLPEARLTGFADAARSDIDAIEPLDPGLRETLQAALAAPDELDAVISALDDALFDAEGPAAAQIEALIERAEVLQQEQKFFLEPDHLDYLERAQQALLDSGLVGKTNALPDVVKVVNRELRGGGGEHYRIPDSSNAVAQTLLQYQSSHRPQDLWHMVTPDYTSTAIWVQLTSGDNQDMTRVQNHMDQWLAANPPPGGADARWAGKTYINVVWQQAMVEGMLSSLLGAFAAVLVIMVVLFRSLKFGLIAMLPLTLTIAFVYGLIGWIGKYYDMPIAVLSALTLGLSIDFAIHFLQRFRSVAAAVGYPAAREAMFEEPARAIFRNAVVIALGFTPLFAAPLVPYITVGAFMASIMLISSAVTLLLLPAVISVFANRLVPAPQPAPVSEPDSQAVRSDTGLPHSSQGASS
ncbi:MAG: MMPL family transporter [Pseudomonadales bacterium]